MPDRLSTPLDAAGPALLAQALQAFGTVCLRALGGSMEPAILPRDILVVAGCGKTADQLAAIRIIIIGVGLILLLIYRPQGFMREYRLQVDLK